MTRSQNPMDPAPTLYDCLHVDYENPTAELTIPKTGLILHPGALYLGSTVERTITKGCVPWMDGRSSLGRLGVQIHATAGRGDDGFGDPDGCTWTLEITVTHPVFVRPKLRVGQITFFDLIGERQPYRGRYSRQQGPAASRLFEDALPPEEEEKP
jgi:dCTP deaminase